jgi:cobalt/nickel transport system permease protein
LARTSFSSHIPDFYLISYFAENGNSIIHRSSSYLKFAYLFLVILATTSIQKTEYLLVLFLFTLVVYRLGNMPLNLLWRWYLIPTSFIFAIAFLFVFNEPGTQFLSLTVLSKVKIQITYEGLVLLLRLILRTLSTVTYSLSLIMTTKYSEICYIANIVLPTPLNTIFILAYRFSFVVLGEIVALLKALSSRGGDLVRGLMTQTRIFGGIFAVAFVHSFDRAERITKAMEARGFERRIPTHSVPGRPSLLGMLILIVVLILITYGLIS